MNLVLRINTKLCWLNLILVLNSPVLTVVNIEFQPNFTNFFETSLLYKTVHIYLYQLLTSLKYTIFI